MAAGEFLIPFSMPSVTESDIEAVTAVLRSGWLTTGEQSALFERELRSYLGASHALAVSSCTHALEICLAYLDLPPGARVGVPTWTFISTALAAVHVGLSPVLIDINEDTLNIDLGSLQAAIDDVDVVIPVHFGGFAVDDAVFDLCRERGVPVIEDAAHALGARYSDGRSVNGSRSVAACYSFYATKNLTSGEGGAIVTEDDGLAQFATSQRLHGMSHDAWRRYRPDGAPVYDLIGPGIKANFPDILAALARSQLARFNELQSRRRIAVEQYREQLADIDGLRCIPTKRADESADHLMVVLLPADLDRATVVQSMNSAGISTSIHFRPLHQFAWMAKNAATGPSGVGVAERVAPHALSLPLFADLANEQVDRVCAALRQSISDARA